MFNCRVCSLGLIVLWMAFIDFCFTISFAYRLVGCLLFMFVGSIGLMIVVFLLILLVVDCGLLCLGFAILVDFVCLIVGLCCCCEFV